MCKEDFQFSGCSPFSLGLGKVTQASVKLYPSKYSYKSRMYLTVERPGYHKLIDVFSHGRARLYNHQMIFQKQKKREKSWWLGMF